MLILKPPVTNKKLVAKLRNPTIPVAQHKEPQNGSNNDKLSEAAIDPLSQVGTHLCKALAQGTRVQARLTGILRRIANLPANEHVSGNPKAPVA
jgi:hypothetical protein